MVCAFSAFELPSSSKAVFLETFGEDWESRWEISSSPDFDGKWYVGEGKLDWGLVGDEGLVVNSVARKHAISSKFSSPIDFTDKPLVLQYEVRFQKQMDCGGAYIKLVRKGEKPFISSKFDASTDYTIMFGPDKCGSMNKVHFIFNHRNPRSGKYEEKHLKERVPAQVDQFTHLYTLVIQPDNSFEVFVDQELKASGSLLDSFEPSVNPPALIDDLEDTKPEDWVDEDLIPDPNAVKPEDWDEDAPEWIEDDAAEMPEGWLEDEPLLVEDAEAIKPLDWDDEADGDWEPPMVDNPKCQVGCGPWERPVVRNEAYKGKWVPPLIENPAFKGLWTPRQIANPLFFEDEHPHNMDAIAGVGFELWTMTDEIMFDNIYVGLEKEGAFEFAESSWRIKREAENQHQEEPSPSEEVSYLHVVQSYIIQAADLVIGNPIPAVVAVFVGLLGFFYFFRVSAAEKSRPKKDEQNDKNE